MTKDEENSLVRVFEDLSVSLDELQETITLISMSRRNVMRVLLVGRSQRELAALLDISPQRVNQLLTTERDK
jgi:hypothetical protein